MRILRQRLGFVCLHIGFRQIQAAIWIAAPNLFWIDYRQLPASIYMPERSHERMTNSSGANQRCSLEEYLAVQRFQRETKLVETNA